MTQPRPDHPRFGPPRAVAVIAPVVLSAVLQVIGIFIAAHASEDRAFVMVAAVLALLASFALAFSRRWPGPTALAVAIACAPAVVLVPGAPLAAVPVAFAVIGAGSRGSRPWAWASVAAYAAVAIAVGATTGHPILLVKPLIIGVLLSLFVAFGEAMRARREHYRTLSRQVAARREADAAAERTRMARELHDVLAHSLSQISVQAGVGLHLFDSRPEQARESLAAIRRTSAIALDEVRGVLGFLRSDDETAARSPLPDLARLPSLVAEFRAGGLEVQVRNDLTREPSSAVQLALFRIVQEAVTNVSRHAHATHVDVAIGESENAYVLTVDDDGRGGVPVEGRGLLGMRERAELLGGTFAATPRAEGGFRVSARIPFHDGRHEDPAIVGGPS
jgi:signal transduction histidine kinase